MSEKAVHTDNFMDSLNKLTGLPVGKIRSYAKENNPFNILEHPRVIEPTERQLGKLHMLREFIASYDVLKMVQDQERITFSSPTEAGKYFTSLLNGMKDKERFMVAFLDNGRNIIETKLVSEGTTDRTFVYPRDILKAALANDCSAIMLAHNHPGHTLKASNEDIELTQSIVNIFKPLGIKVIDHIIVGGYSFNSMAANGLLPDTPNRLANYDPISMVPCNEAHEQLETDFDEGIGI